MSHQVSSRQLIQPRSAATGLVLLMSVFGAGAFGQTFVWGILAPDIQAATQTTNAEFAAAISVASLAASAVYLFAGLFAAQVRPDRLLAASLMLTGLALPWFMSAATSWAGLLIVFFLVRVTSRHMLFHACEITISANRAELGRFGAMLMSSAYPLSLFMIPPVIVAVLAVSDLTCLFMIAAAYAFAVGTAALLTGPRAARPVADTKTSPFSGAFDLLLTSRFLLLTAIYCVTFGLDTAALLFHKTLFEGTSSVDILSVYAIAQIAGTGLATFLSPRVSGQVFLWCHLAVLVTGIGCLAVLPNYGHIGFFLGLGGSIAMSNYAAVYLWSSEFTLLDFARAVVPRGFVAASAGAVIAVGIGSLIDRGASLDILILFSAAAVLVAFAGIAAYHLMGPASDTETDSNREPQPTSEIKVVTERGVADAV
jgi:hypothetical protein